MKITIEVTPEGIQVSANHYNRGARTEIFRKAKDLQDVLGFVETSIRARVKCFRKRVTK